MAYRIKTVSQLTGIPRPTIVAWERRYAMLEPTRSEVGYRTYSDEDVQYLSALKKLADQGVAISEAISRVPKPGVVSLPGTAQTSEGLVTQVVNALTAFDRDPALLRRVEQMAFSDAIQHLWEPVLHETGRRWEAGDISVAQEHFVSGVAREAYVAMLRSLGHGSSAGPQVVCACLPTEHHDLPLLAVAVQLALAGWRVVWLGADLPLPDLCAHVVGQAPEVVCLSAVTVPSESVLIAGRTVLSSAPKGTTVVLGGPASQNLRERQSGRLWVCASATELVQRWADRAEGRGLVVTRGGR